MIDPRSIEQVDPAMADLIRRDVERQNTSIHLIASENFVSKAVLQATGSVFTNKYAEGYPGRRYYEGCEVVDEMERLAQMRLLELLGGVHANVQPHSGAQANMAVYFSLLDLGDTVLGMRLDQGGHLTHGSPVNFSGRYYNFIAYGVDPATERIDMDEVRKLAQEHRPKILLAGYSSYPRHLEYEKFREIADEVGAIFMVDAAHYIGLVAGKAFPNPIEHADVVTFTTHKALRGARGGSIITNNEEMGLEIQKGLFPNAQGGSLYNQIAGKAVCFHEAAQPEFQAYAQQVIDNARAMAAHFMENGIRLVSDGTDNHMMLIDLRSVDEDLTGKAAAKMLDRIGVTLNFNTIPFDPRPPYSASGLRIGTPSVTTQGMKEEEMVQVADLITEALRNHGEERVLAATASQVRQLAGQFSPYPEGFVGHV
ncbi:MAG: serine hydroxymethyltransferase [Acidimicrobiia bacterium]|nr:serine hydroxymethyltransferase [Acidimicrobiia bacterium]